jgi:TRAP-type transport system periplasmic protein
MTLSRHRFVLSAATTLAAAGVVTRAQAAEFDLKFGNDLAPEHPLNVRAVEAFARIAKATNGRVTVKAFANSQLGGDPAMVTQLRTGALEMAAMPGAFLTLVPVAQIENLAYAFPNRETVFRAMDGDLGAVIRSEIRAKGIVVMDKIWENGFRDITTSSKPVRSVADVQGLKIRVSPGKIRIDTFQSLGAAPTPIATNELYTALQTHLVDAEENALLNIETQKFFEVQKYVSRSQHMWTGYWFLVNQDLWNRFPPDLQRTVATELNRGAVLARNDTGQLSRSIEDKLQRRGMTFTDCDTASFRKKLIDAKYYERWRAEFGPTAWTALEKYASRLS